MARMYAMDHRTAAVVGWEQVGAMQLAPLGWVWLGWQTIQGRRAS